MSRFSKDELPAEEYFALRAFRSSQNKIAGTLFFFIAIEFIAAVVVAIITIAVPDEAANDPIFGEITSIALYLCVFVCAIGFFIGITHKKLSSSVSLRMRLPKRPFSAVFLCLSVFYMGNVLSYFLDRFLTVFGLPEAQNTISFTSDSGIGILLLSLLSTALLPALLEEILFRGLILGELSRYGRSIAILLSGALFGLVHMTTTQILFAAVGGVLLAHFVFESGSLLLGMIVHFINNAVAVLLSFASVHLPENMYYTISIVLDITIFVLGIVSAILLFRRKSESGPLPSDGDSAWLSKTEPQRVTLRGGVLSTLSVGTVLFAVTAVLSAIFTLTLS